ncbi:Rha family transcriptional regulator [Shouchella lehensis]|uniref:Rha family transcriptional regulator n=1 Tax=Shouchella lehensis TaxID=300825 RepID=A0A4Y7WDI8_9BACI|nr:Rha family transcriptional regulator [Shouchella lehensis]TES45677.1 Rha family transcriptional regulator [Shouchella lehensis]
MKELVFIENGRTLTDSLTIAEMFSKSHKNVLAHIKNQLTKLLEAGESEFSQLNFQPSSYLNRGKRYDKILLTKEAFSLVTMAYVTIEAMKYKVKFISKFNEMERKLLEPRVLSDKEQLIASMQLTLETSKEVTAVRKDVDELKLVVNKKMTLDYGQQQVLLRMKNTRVEKFWKLNPHLQPTLTKKMLHANAWKDLKEAFHVASYRDIRQSDLQKAINYLNDWQPRNKWLEMKAKKRCENND